ncbi:MAG TPA: cytochrome d ubiquinol oxidase subunit II, partial [Gemmatimonadaceae bacterium]
MVFTAFPDVFATLGIVLHIPLSLMLIGIVLRGSAFVFRSYDPRDDSVRRKWGRLFAVTSLLTPALLGMVIGAIASGAVGDAAGRLAAMHAGSATTDSFASIYLLPWLAPFPFITGVLALTMFAFLAAVYLAVAATDGALREDFRRHALAAAAMVVVVGGVGLAAARVYASQAGGVMVANGWSTAIQIAAGAAALVCVIALWTRRWQVARLAAGAQVSLILWGWVVAQYPWIIPRTHDIRTASAPMVTLKLLLAALAVGAVILLPSLVYLYRTFARVHAPSA